MGYGGMRWLWAAVSRRSTTTECQPVAPLGTVPARLSVCVQPVAVGGADLEACGRPGVACHG